MCRFQQNGHEEVNSCIMTLSDVHLLVEFGTHKTIRRRQWVLKSAFGKVQDKVTNAVYGIEKQKNFKDELFSTVDKDMMGRREASVMNSKETCC
jgi:isoaspartyl peptidase/L-asparaginase-like protein (Ntn-hydrolase superfamily)